VGCFLSLARWVALELACALLASAAAACTTRDEKPASSDSSSRGASAGPDTLSSRDRRDRDDFDDSILVRAPAQRIVSLSPATTEMLFALGAGPRLVGRTSWDLYPDSARLIPDVGNGLRPNVEAILATKPDLVVLYASNDNRDAARSFRAAGIATLSLKIDRIEHFRRAVLLLGAAVGDTVRARTVADSVTRTLDRVRVATAALKRPTVFWHVWDAPLITIGGGSYLSQLVDIAGGRNLYGDLPDPSPQITLEDLLARDVDVILAGPTSAPRLRTDPKWQSLAAVKAGRVLVIDTAVVGRPGIRLGEAATSIARLLHPGLTP
jgi:iron complex transport system substrate-binding protein